jgi:hypothetical protein
VSQNCAAKWNRTFSLFEVATLPSRKNCYQIRSMYSKEMRF